MRNLHGHRKNMHLQYNILAVINGTHFGDDNISSGGTPRWDTLFSSTYGGNDSVSVFSCHYEVRLGDGDDYLAGGIGGKAYGGAGDDRLTAFLWEGTHAHFGGDGNDKMYVYYGGTDSSYTGSGGAGHDRFYDLTSAPGSVSFNGGDGFDVVTHTSSTPISLTLDSTGNQGGAPKSYFGIEGVVGGLGDDTMTGNRVGNLMVGGNGSDVINGEAGNDFLIGEARGENFIGAYLGVNINFSPADAFDPLNENVAGSYASDGGGLSDSLYGGTGNDVLSGGDGADLLNGGYGNDWVTYLSSDATLTIALNLATGGTVGHAAGDVFVSIENVQGSAGNDTITGNNAANELRGMYNQDSLSGLGGNDTLDGGRGRDTLVGGAGNDSLTGGDAEDAFVFAGPANQLGVDTITDMTANFDEIWLSAAAFRQVGPAGADLTAGFFAIGSAAAERDDRIIYDPTTGALFYDADGSRAITAAVQIAQLATGLALTASDFVVIA